VLDTRGRQRLRLDEQAIALAGDRFDVARLPCIVAKRPPQFRNRLVDRVVTHRASVPHATDQLVAAHDLAAALGQHEQHRHGLGFEIHARRSARLGQPVRVRFDDELPQPKSRRRHETIVRNEMGRVRAGLCARIEIRVNVRALRRLPPPRCSRPINEQEPSRGGTPMVTRMTFVAARLTASITATLAFVAAIGCALPATAQAADANVSVYASGFNNPRGLKFGPDGNLYVAEGGVGGSTVAPDRAACFVPPPVGPYHGDTTGSRISMVDKFQNVTTARAVSRRARRRPTLDRS
jgi:hypothetical protein